MPLKPCSVPNDLNCAAFVGAIFQNCKDKWVHVIMSSIIRLQLASKQALITIHLPRRYPNGAMAIGNGTIVPPSSSIVVPGSALTAPCSNASCFCTNKAAGNYSNPYAFDARAYIACSGAGGVAIAANCTGTREVYNATARACRKLPCTSISCACEYAPSPGAYINPFANNSRSYLVCGGASGPQLASCLEDEFFNATKQSCDPLPCPNITCACDGITAPGAYSNPFATNASSYLLCDGNSSTTLANCDEGQYFNGTTRTCTSTPEEKQQACLDNPACFCKDRTDGLYEIYGNETLVRCSGKAGSLISCADVNGTWDSNTTHCVMPQPDDALGVCAELGCFCTNKKPGNYPNVFAPDLSELMPQSYIACSGGQASVQLCDQGSFWVNWEGRCALVPTANGTAVGGNHTTNGNSNADSQSPPSGVQP